MNQFIKYILFLLFISIAGYSQDVDERYPDIPNPEKKFPELNDIDKVKYVKILKYYSDSLGNFLEKIEASGYEPEIFINKYPYRYLYKVLPETTDTISKIIYKYNENKNILEYVNEQRTQSYVYKNKGYHYGYNQRYRQYNENGETIKEDIYSENQLSSSKKWIYNSENLLIRNEDLRYYEDKVNFNNITYYLYNRNNQLVRKIENSNNEIININSWAYDENNSYHITETSAYKNSVNIAIQKDFNSSSDDRYYIGSRLIDTLSDENNNWIKKTYQNRYGYYAIEREIIYK